MNSPRPVSFSEARSWQPQDQPAASDAFVRVMDICQEYREIYNISLII